ncbi:MAG: hypothetical protein R3C59_16890 [Planctomycetaceae bacterium]
MAKKKTTKTHATPPKAATKSAATPVAQRARISSDDLPRRTLEAAIPIAEIIRDTYHGKSATWDEIASVLDVSPTTPANRYPMWAAVAYGLLRKEGEQYHLAETGRKIIAPNYEGEREEGILKAILTPAILSRFYQDYNGSPLPGDEHFLNVLENRYDIPRNRAAESRDMIVDNARFAGILRERGVGGATLEFSLTGAPTPRPRDQDDESEADAFPEKTEQTDDREEESLGDLSKACFIITPLGSDDSVERRHANTVFEHLIKPVLKEFDIEPIRADKISKPGIITKQIIEHLAGCRLCIADLSFNNPNAFYELGVRQAFLLSTIQVIRKGDKIPFDVSQGRTIIIDTSDPYTIMDRFDSARAELREHVSSCLNGGERPDDNPVAMYLPKLVVKVPK